MGSNSSGGLRCSGHIGDGSTALREVPEAATLDRTPGTDSIRLLGPAHTNN